MVGWKLMYNECQWRQERERSFFSLTVALARWKNKNHQVIFLPPLYITWKDCQMCSSWVDMEALMRIDHGLNCPLFGSNAPKSSSTSKCSSLHMPFSGISSTNAESFCYVVEISYDFLNSNCTYVNQITICYIWEKLKSIGPYCQVSLTYEHGLHSEGSQRKL